MHINSWVIDEYMLIYKWRSYQTNLSSVKNLHHTYNLQFVLLLYIIVFNKYLHFKYKHSFTNILYVNEI
jgi:hypothetical protein